ncbi:Sodium bicarbonate cotransporter 3 [Xenoophorus captivus]|uniref:Sodium bicarbonate cotransporter 3 n=1 Tax=Xenoophorus captivus TaxID=1517983 RepID=A0ABV0QEQ6_9TELE
MTSSTSHMTSSLSWMSCPLEMVAQLSGERPPDMVIDSMVASGQLKEDLRDKVREAMLKKHHHQNERKLSNRIPLVRSIADIGKKHSDPLLLERNGEILQRTHISCSSIRLTLGNCA